VCSKKQNYLLGEQQSGLIRNVSFHLKLFAFYILAGRLKRKIGRQFLPTLEIMSGIKVESRTKNVVLPLKLFPKQSNLKPALPALRCQQFCIHYSIQKVMLFHKTGLV